MVLWFFLLVKGKKDEEKDARLRYEGVLKCGYGLLPMMVVADRRLSSTAVRLYGALSNFARDKDVAFPSQKTLADILNLHVPRVSELTSELEEVGYIEKIYERGRLTYILKEIIDVELQRDLFGNFVVDKMQVGNVPKRRKTEAVPKKELKEIGEYYEKKFKEVAKIEPVIDFARDNKILSPYIKKYGIEMTKKIIDEFFKNDFAKKCSYKITILKTVSNDLLMKVKKKGTKKYGYEEV